MEAYSERKAVNYKKIDNIQKVLYEIAERAALDLTTIKKEIAILQSSDFYCFPVRHHSIAASFHLLNALEQRKPKIIFIEMTEEAQDLIPYIVDKDTTPPIAVFGFFKDDNNVLGLNGVITASTDIPAKFQAWYPFLSYSPEYVALKYAQEHKIPVYFIDLPYITLLKKILTKNKDFIEKSEETNEQIDVAETLDAEKTFTENEYLKLFNNMFGTNDLDEVWDTLFEIGTESMNSDDYRNLILLFCFCLRESTDPNALELDGIHERERFMRFLIDEKIKLHRLSAHDAFIVVGGMHAIAIPRIALNPQQIKEQKEIYDKPNEMDHSLIPFSFKRFSNLYGYQSGIKSPRFAQKVWENTKEKNTSSYTTASTEFIIDLMDKARKRGHLLSTADAISSVQFAQMLANMRFRSEPNSRDVFDALVACCVKGNPEKDDLNLQELIEKELIGYSIGKVTAQYVKMGLRNDLIESLAAFDIELIDKSQHFSLDLKEHSDLLKSQLFWRIFFLDLGIITLNFSALNSTAQLHDINILFKEKWELTWNQELDVKITERTAYGSTLEEASLNFLKEKLSLIEMDSKKIVELLHYSLNMDLLTGIPILVSEAEKQIIGDPDVFNLFDAFSMLLILQRMTGIRRPELKADFDKLITMTYFGICTLLPQQSNPKPELKDLLMHHFSELANTIICNFQLNLDLNVLDGALNALLNYTNDPNIAGACCGSRYLIGTMNSTEIKNEMITISKSSPDKRIKFGDFVNGLINSCKQKIIFDDTIIDALIAIIQETDWTIFRYILPSLRKTFNSLSAREYDRILDRISEKYNVTHIKEVVIIDPKEELVRLIKILDTKTREIMDRW
jgi:hypothetical protein